MGGGGGGDKYGGAGGVKPMRIAGRVEQERERLSGMTAEDRAWRKLWLKDQVLSPNEPKYVQATHKELLNPIRRFYRFPLDFFFNKIVAPVTGPVPASVFRFYTGRILIGVWAGYAMFYYFKYNTNDWLGKGRWRVIESRKAVYPGEPGYPYVNPIKQPHEYHDREFGKSVLAKSYPQYQN